MSKSNYLDSVWRRSLEEMINILNVDLDKLLNTMEETNCFTSTTTKNNILGQGSDYQKYESLIDWILKATPEQYMSFKKALENENQNHAINKRDKDQKKIDKLIKRSEQIRDGTYLSNLLGITGNLVQWHPKDMAYICNNENMYKGLALIINNVNFEHSSQRIGSNKDRESMKMLLKHFGYDVEVHNDKTKKQMEEIISNFANNIKHRSADSTVVVLLSHGVDGCVSGTDGKLMKVECFKKRLNLDNCSYLKNKPKMFIIQACRNKPTSRWHLPNLTVANIKEQIISLKEYFFTYIWKADSLIEQQVDDAQFLHLETDYIIVNSTTSGTSSHRDEETGTRFIQSLCEVVAMSAKKTHIADLLAEVNKMITHYGYAGHQQISEYSSTLRRRFYFHKSPVGKNKETKIKKQKEYE